MTSLHKKFSNTMKLLGIPAGATMAVACSGGGDSMALSLLAAGWAKTQKMRLVTLTVDHGLRPESASEAKQVAGWFKKRAIAHVILRWKGAKPSRNIQEEARKLRYQMLSHYCKTHQISYLLVAHHLEDQAETFLLRLARGSGVDGLSAMSAVSFLYGITLVRPLLDVAKSELVTLLKKEGQDFIADPSNENAVFDRVKMRKLMPALAGIGLSADRLAKTATNMARARAHLEEETGRFLKQYCTIAPEGYATLGSVQGSEEIVLRALSTLIMLVGGHEVKTRLGDLQRLYASLQAPSFRGATLGGCIFTRQKKGFLVLREPGAAHGPVAIGAGKTLLWDNRFSVTLTKADTKLSLGALSQEGWLFVARTYRLESTCPDKRILYTLPALRDKEGWIYAVPHLGLAAPGTVCSASFKTL